MPSAINRGSPSTMVNLGDLGVDVHAIVYTLDANFLTCIV